MKNRLFLLLIVIICLFQASILDSFKVFGVKPDLLLACVILSGLFFEARPAFFLCLSIGFLKDAFGVNSFGINTALCPLWYYLVRQASKKISVDNRILLSIGAAIVVLINAVATRIILASLGSFVSWLVFLRVAFIESVYTALTFPLLYKALRPVLLMKALKEEELIDEEI